MSVRTVLTTTLTMLLIAAIGGCTPTTGQQDPPTPPPPTVTRMPTNSPTPTEPPSPLPPTIEPLPIPPTPMPPARDLDTVERAKADLADRLPVDSTEIVLVEMFADEFPAGDLGCPTPKQPSLPMPAFVTGQVIVLAAQGEKYHYHTHGPQVIFCGKQ